MSTETVKCSHCKEYKPKSEVLANKQAYWTPDLPYPKGIQFVCRACGALKARLWMQKKGKAKRNETNLKTRRKYRERWNARILLRYHVKVGNVIKPLKCEKCGEKKPLQAHHEDYSKALEVNWYCTGCHADRHKELKPKKAKEFKVCECGKKYFGTCSRCYFRKLRGVKKPRV